MPPVAEIALELMDAMKERRPRHAQGQLATPTGPVLFLETGVPDVCLRPLRPTDREHPLFLWALKQQNRWDRAGLCDASLADHAQWWQASMSIWPSAGSHRNYGRRAHAVAVLERRGMNHEEISDALGYLADDLARMQRKPKERSALRDARAFHTHGAVTDYCLPRIFTIPYAAPDPNAFPNFSAGDFVGLVADDKETEQLAAAVAAISG